MSLIINNSTTNIAIYNDVLRVEWYNAGEGLCGDFNPEDPEDENLLRFDVYCKYTDSEDWVPVDDASYCTQVSADTSKNRLVELLTIIFNRYEDVIRDYINYGTSVKKLGEELSWISA